MKTKLVATRLPISLADRLAVEVEKSDSNVADVLREAVIKMFNDIDEGERLAALEARLSAKIDALSQKLDELTIEEITS